NMLTFYTYKCEDYCSDSISDEIHMWGIDEQMNDVLVRVKGFNFSFIVEVPQNLSDQQYSKIASYIRTKVFSPGVIKRINGINLYEYKHFGTLLCLRVYINRYEELSEIRRKLRYAGRNNEWNCQFRIHQAEAPLHLQYISQYNLSYGNWHYSREYVRVSDDSKISRATHEYLVQYDKLHMMKMEEGCAAANQCSNDHCMHTVGSISVNPRVLSYDIECYSKNGTFPNPNNIWDEVFIITTSVMDRDGSIKNTAFIRHGYTGQDVENTTIVTCRDEEELLVKFQQFIIDSNPEICMGYNTDGFDNPYITQRLYNLGLEWMNISKLKESSISTRRPNKISA